MITEYGWIIQNGYETLFTTALGYHLKVHFLSADSSCLCPYRVLIPNESKQYRIWNSNESIGKSVRELELEHNHNPNLHIERERERDLTYLRMAIHTHCTAIYC